MGEGADFGANFWIRVGLVAIAGLYVVGALSVLEHVWPAATTGSLRSVATQRFNGGDGGYCKHSRD